MAAFSSFDPDPELDDPEDDVRTGKYTYDDGTTRYGQYDSAEVKRLQDEREKRAQDAAAPAPAEPLMSMAPKPEPMMSEQPPEGKGSIDIPRSSRIAWVHNNPGNLKYAGQDGAERGEPAQDGGHWASFASPEEGYAALKHQVERDGNKGMTLGQFINNYAPPTSNDTAGYLMGASKALGASPDTPISSIDTDKLSRFIAQKESSTRIDGAPITSSQPSTAPQLPGMGGSAQTVAGLPLAQAEMDGRQLTPDQLQARQQQVMDQANQQAAGYQQAAAARQQGRDEALQVVQKNYQDQQTNAQRQMDEQGQIRLEAQQKVQDNMSQQLEPNRVIKQAGAGGAILGVLAVMMSGVGQAFQTWGGNHNTTNGAMDTLNKTIDDDIEEQKKDKQSRVAYWSRVYGDADQGVKAAKVEMLNASAQIMQAQASTKVQNADIQADVMQKSQDLLARGQQLTTELQSKEEDKLKLKYAAPKPVKQGDVAGQVKKASDAYQSLQKSGYTHEQIAPIMGALGLPMPSGQSELNRKSAAEEGKATTQQADAQAGVDAVQEWAKARGLIQDPQTGEYKADPQKGSSFADRVIDSAKAAVPGQTSPMTNIHKQGSLAVGHAVRGPRVNLNEVDTYGDIYLGKMSDSDEQVANKLNSTMKILKEKLRPSKRDEPSESMPYEEVE